MTSQNVLTPKRVKKLTKRIRNGARRLGNRWAYLLILLPAAAEWLDNTRPPTDPFEVSKVTIIGAVLGICVWLLYRESDRLKALADTDELTGLFNRRRFNEDIEIETLRAKRLDVPLTLLYFDVDNFKSINDTHGHVQGDLILKEAARFLKSSVRRHVDHCYRIGGDEFAVLLVGAHVEEAIEAIKRRRAELTRGTVLDECHISFSVGAVELNDASAAELVKKADQYMYAAKRGEDLRISTSACFAKV